MNYDVDLFIIIGNDGDLIFHHGVEFFGYLIFLLLRKLGENCLSQSNVV